MADPVITEVTIAEADAYLPSRELMEAEAYLVSRGACPLALAGLAAAVLVLDKLDTAKRSGS